MRSFKFERSSGRQHDPATKDSVFLRRQLSAQLQVLVRLHLDAGKQGQEGKPEQKAGKVSSDVPVRFYQGVFQLLEREFFGCILVLLKHNSALMYLVQSCFITRLQRLVRKSL